MLKEADYPGHSQRELHQQEDGQLLLTLFAHTFGQPDGGRGVLLPHAFHATTVGEEPEADDSGADDGIQQKQAQRQHNSEPHVGGPNPAADCEWISIVC
jgi:hypothetical protein